MTLNLPDPLAVIGMKEIDRRRFFGLAGIGAGAMALAACGGPSTAPPSSAAGSSGAPAEENYDGVKPAASVTFWSNHPGKSEDVEKQIISAFNASGAGIQVKLVTGGANYEEIAQKFQTAQTGGGLPDLLVLSDVWWARYYMQKSIIPLDSVMKTVGIDATKYRKQLIADYQFKGGQWAIPYARSTPLFYYNKEHWKKAGLEDRAPKTWAEFAEWGPKLTAAGTGAQHAYQHPALADYAGWVFQNILWGYGGGWSTDFTVTCDSAESVQALQFLQDSVYKGKWAGVSSKSATDDLSAGAVSATIGSTGSLVGVQKAAKFDVGVGFLPGGPKAATGVCPTGGAGVGIPKGIPKENQLAAATFIKFLTAPENAVKFSQATGYLPVREDADATALVKANPLAQIAIDQLAVTKTQDNIRVFVPGADQEMAKSCLAILTQQKPVQETMTALKKTLTDLYEKSVKPNL
jgi:sn-glycerol 3-phosphate transport system substrate-binding protein